MTSPLRPLAKTGDYRRQGTIAGKMVKGRAIREQTYWSAVAAKLRRDKLTVAAIFGLVVMVSLSVAAPWLSDRLLGFDPTATDLTNRHAPPSWAAPST